MAQESTFSLKNVLLFKNLNDDEIEIVSKELKEKDFDVNVRVIEEKSVGDELYIIKKGKVEITLTRDDSVLVLAELGDYSFFGEMAILREKERSASVTTTEPCSFYILKRNKLLSLIDSHPKIAANIFMAIAGVLSDRIAKTNDNLETYFLINKAIVDNEQFRRLYIMSKSSKEK
ncbi:MAG: cyclic nucleotide-binding domain-containing protein [Candidatus Cloacimonadota bacterium]|nr:MAG: cyclic nucleotide-binding domain-containing protein [Candidatus Cloacimonadota bacterium]